MAQIFAELSKEGVLIVGMLTILVVVGIFLCFEIILLHNKYNKMATKQERMDAALATLQAGFVELADDLNALIEEVKDTINEESLAKLEGYAAKATELGNLWEKPEEPTEETEA